MNVHIDPTDANGNSSSPESRSIRVEDNGLVVDLRSGALSAGTANVDIVIGFLEQAASLSSGRGKIAENEIAFITAFMRDQAPRDVTESALLMQMAVIHRQFVQAASELEKAVLQDEANQLRRALSQLGRTFSIQLAGLEIYRLRRAERQKAEAPRPRRGQATQRPPVGKSAIDIAAPRTH